MNLRTLVIAFCAIGAQAGTVTEISVDFTDFTKDIHFTVAGHLKDEDPRSSNLKGKPGTYSGKIDVGNYDAGWTEPPGKGTYTFTFKRDATNGWDGRYWLTTDGSLKRPNVEPTGTFASLFIDPVPGGTAVYAENAVGNHDETISNLVATVVSGLGSIDSPNWTSAPGTDYSLSGGFAAMGASAVPMGTIPTLGDDQWVRFSFEADGTPFFFGSTAPTPEPATPVLFGAGCLLIAAARLKRKVLGPR